MMNALRAASSHLESCTVKSSVRKINGFDHASSVLYVKVLYVITAVLYIL